MSSGEVTLLKKKKHTEIQCDYDGLTKEELVRIVRGWKFLFLFYWPIFGQLKFESADVRKSRHGLHFRIFVKNQIPDWMIPFIQLCLRSHRAREVLNLTRVLTPELQDGHEFNVLYNTKYQMIPDGLIQTGEETPQPRLTAQVTRIVKGFSKRRKRRVKK
ncbi:MAG: hypothetical protein ACHQ03_07800 [Candidatus Bathyarchaeia archaeon]